MALTKEELAELAELEADEKAVAAERADEVARQRLDAKRSRKKLAQKHGVHGRDFVVLETTAGVNVAVRRPLDVEVDTVGESPDDRGAQEKFLIGITLEPAADEMGRLLAQWPGLLGAVIPKAFDLIGKVREEDAKK